jgi:YggT family protein
MLALISLALFVLQVLLIARAVLDWSVVLAGPSVAGSLRYRLTRGVTAITEPILAPVRRVIPPLRVGGASFDLAFLVVFFAIVVLRMIL